MARLAQQIDRDLRDLRHHPEDAELMLRLSSHGLRLLPLLAPHLASDLPIAVLERYEALFKSVLRRSLARQVSGDTARQLAAFQIEVGLLLKYKSYAVKASSPLGYSIFLQNPGEGFSFQRHTRHKTEVFHILDVHPGGFVFLCTYDEWCDCYDPDRFAAWLAGAGADPAYDRFRYDVAAGDVFVLDELGIVHTVIGCMLEEFATISTDMVERLHDQNLGKPIPSAFNKEFACSGLRAIGTPAESRLVAGPAASPSRRPLVPVEIVGGSKTVLARGFVTASQIAVAPRAETEIERDERHAASLYIRAGRGRLLIGTAAELARTSAPSLAITAHDLLTLPPGIGYAFVNESAEPLEVVEHRIEPTVALL